MVKFALKGAVENLSPALLLKAGRQHPGGKWILLDSARGRTAPLQQADGRLAVRTKGTAPGGVGSPVLMTRVVPSVGERWRQCQYSQYPCAR